MNTSGFQCSVFIGVMMVVAVYSASVHNRPPDKDKHVILLRHIENATNHLLHQKLHGWVPKVYNELCTAHFFCLADKVVETNLTQPKFIGLRKALHEYNKTIMAHCQLDNELDDYQLKEFVWNVNRCATLLLNHTR